MVFGYIQIIVLGGGQEGKLASILLPSMGPRFSSLLTFVPFS